MRRLLQSARVSWLVVVAYALLILSISSIPATSMPRSPELWRWDKLIHSLEYAIAAALFFRALQFSRFGTGATRIVLSALAFSFFGVVDELYQGTVSGRDSSGFDMIADMSGACFASLASAVFYSRKRSPRVDHSQFQQQDT